MANEAIIARIAISPAEYAEIRKQAIDDGTTTAKFLAKIVRAYQPQEGGKKK